MSIPILITIAIGLLLYAIMVLLCVGAAVNKRIREWAYMSILVDICFMSGSFLLLVAFGSYVVFDTPK